MEYFDIVDYEGRPTGETVSRESAHRDGINHRTAHVWIVREACGRVQVLLQKRSLQKDSFPGLYDTSSAGHIPAGDEPVGSALRELSEELGLEAKPEDLNFAGKFNIDYTMDFHGKPFHDKEVTWVYVYDKPVNETRLALQESEVSEVRWFDLEEVDRGIKLPDSIFCPPQKGINVLKKYLEGKKNAVRPVKRNVLLNPGPSTTADSVKYAQVVPDICPRESEFGGLMKGLREDLVKIVHGDLDKYTSVLFCGSGTINIDVCINSLLPEGKKALIVNNGAYSTRAVEVCQYYGLPHIDLRFPVDQLPDLEEVEKTLIANPDIALIHTTHNETGTGILNPIREIGALAHKYGAIFTVDTTSTYAMRPIDIEKDNIDFCMASAQKGLTAFTGLSFIVGNRAAIEKSREYPKRSYYCNLYMQYDFFERTGEMHFTPPVQTIYATIQALKEYWAEGEEAKWARHTRVFNAINEGLDRLGFRQVIKPEWRAGLVSSAIYPDDPNWSFERVHDYCYERGFTIYPGKISTTNTFRLCALGAIDEQDIKDFFEVFTEALKESGVRIPVNYNE